MRDNERIEVPGLVADSRIVFGVLNHLSRDAASAKFAACDRVMPNLRVEGIFRRNRSSEGEKLHPSSLSLSLSLSILRPLPLSLCQYTS